MSELHHLLTFPVRPVTEEAYLKPLASFLKSGIPATYTLEQAAAFERGDEDENDDNDKEGGSNTTPMHILARSLPEDLTEEETCAVLKMLDMLFEYGAGWSFLDYENKAVGDLLLERGQPKGGQLYQRIVEAGVSAELLLRKIDGGEVEFLDENEFDPSTNVNEPVDVVTSSETAAKITDDPDATAGDQMTYLNTKLEYTEDALVTEENRDGVMMEWEDQIMKLAADAMFPSSLESPHDAIVLNIGFGMGIIDTYIQAKGPQKHYICEAHPDVIAKMKKDGWYEKPNVVVLEGRWQDSLNKLLDEGETFFDGIYYDTFSEHYQDMLDLYDVIVGLIKPEGVFSFFNGLGADREICYDVYKKIVEIDVATYGMKCEFETIDITKILPDWKDVKRSYYNCNYYYHPRISFI
ncbi:protein arginine N-methyltransferase 2 [Monosporozyma unispora]|nr:Arginine N-methyltransferase 2 [Kazachstania unispora]